MKHSSLILTSLILCSSTAYAEGQATLTGSTLRIHKASYRDIFYDVQMQYRAPSTLILVSATPLTEMLNAPVVKVNDDLSFKLTDIRTSCLTFSANIASRGGKKFQVANIVSMIDTTEILNFSNLGVLAEGSFS